MCVCVYPRERAPDHEGSEGDRSNFVRDGKILFYTGRRVHGRVIQNVRLWPGDQVDCATVNDCSRLSIVLRLKLGG